MSRLQLDLRVGCHLALPDSHHDDLVNCCIIRNAADRAGCWPECSKLSAQPRQRYHGWRWGDTAPAVDSFIETVGQSTVLIGI